MFESCLVDLKVEYLCDVRSDSWISHSFGHGGHVIDVLHDHKRASTRDGVLLRGTKVVHCRHGNGRVLLDVSHESDLVTELLLGEVDYVGSRNTQASGRAVFVLDPEDNIEAAAYRGV